MVKKFFVRKKIFLIPFLFHLLSPLCFGFTNEEIQKLQTSMMESPVGERIAFWAEKFVGTPYDRDPLGEYVSKATIVADERVDCMYLTFRAVELALSRSPEEAIQIALEKRFHSKGILKEDRVLNYDNRFEYGEDMISSGKWGREITAEIGKTHRIRGSRGNPSVEILSSKALLRDRGTLKNGDLLFFIKRPEERRREEMVGHIGIVKVENGDVFMIHASGTKEKGGVVKKIQLKEYLSKTSFIGLKITRFY